MTTNEKKVLQKDFTLKRRLQRRVKEAEAIVEAHRAECHVRDRRLKVREEEIKRRNTDLVYLLRKARKHELALKDKAAKENALPGGENANAFNPPPWEPQRSPPSYVVPQNRELDDLEAAAANPTAPLPPQLAASPSRDFYRPQSDAGSPPKPLDVVPAAAADAATTKKRDVAQDEFKAVLRRVQVMEDELVEELRAFDGSREQEEADAVEAALKDVQAAERLVLAAEGLATNTTTRPATSPQQAGALALDAGAPRPYAARNLPERPATAATPTRPAMNRPQSAKAARPDSAGPIREEAWASTVNMVDGPVPAPDPVYTIRQHEFDIPEFGN